MFPLILFLFSVLIDDVQKLIDEQFVVERRNKRSLTTFDYTKYHPMNEVRWGLYGITKKYDKIKKSKNYCLLLLCNIYIGNMYLIKRFIYQKQKV